MLYQSTNGNCQVTIQEDGSREVTWEDTRQLQYPLNLDVKITEYCDLSRICVYCHEQSNIQGKHGNLNAGLKFFKDLPAGTEIAIGGGNPLAHPNLVVFLRKLKEYNLIANLTVNQLHVKANTDVLFYLFNQKLIYGLGISVRNQDYKSIKDVLSYSTNIVFHVIAGLDNINVINAIYNATTTPKILILGYKQFGNGVDHFQTNTKIIEDNLYNWYTSLHEHFGRKGLVLSFDNLAIKQLKLQRFFSQTDWDTFYQGDDGEGSMYIDLIKEQFCVSSTASKRYMMSDFAMSSSFAMIQSNRKSAL